MSSTHLGQPTMDIFAATVAAAVGSWRLVGAGNKLAVDGAAVDAMRASLRGAEFGGIVVIGEGEKDEAPMLFNGEIIGGGRPLEWDIAVDPIDGTALAAEGVPGAVSVMAAAERGGMLAAPEVFYMQKIVSGPAGRGVLSLDYSPEDNIRLLAEELGKTIEEMNVAIIDKGRNHDLIKRVQDLGANWVRFAEGDVAMAVAAAVGDVGVDLLLGIGGNPEGVVTACAVQALGGFMEGRLMPLTPDEMSRALGAGYNVEKTYGLDELASGERFIFVLTGITDGLLAKGIREDGDSLFLQSFVLDSDVDEARLLEVRIPS
ncbi:MAG: fructose-bisphosphatase class II family protein [Actinomycetales bacterium]|nr:fructose-bisphosphatase class II family protein [Actinomycetales bacterium]